MLDTGYRVIIAAEGTGSAARVAALLAEHGLHAPIIDPPTAAITTPGLRIVVAPMQRGFVLPRQRLAVAAETDVTGRRRLHRAARPRRRGASGSIFEQARPRTCRDGCSDQPPPSSARGQCRRRDFP